MASKLVVFASLGVMVVTSMAFSQEERPTEEEIGAIQVYLTPAEAVWEVFDDIAGMDTTVAVLTLEEMKELHALLGAAVPSDTVVVLKLRGENGERLGYAVIAEEVGKYRPITFMVGITPEFKVHRVEVLVYRESRGGEVRRSRFLRQYRGKSAGSPIRTNRDILNIAGATMSVNALNHGVKRVLATLEVLAARNSL